MKKTLAAMLFIIAIAPAIGQQQAPTQKPSVEELQTELAKAQITISELKQQIIQVQQQLVDVQRQGLACLAREVDTEHSAAVDKLKSLDKKAPVETPPAKK